VDDERKSASLVVVCCLLFVAHFSSWPMARTTDTKNYLFGLVYRIFCCHIRGFVQGRELLQQEKIPWGKFRFSDRCRNFSPKFFAQYGLFLAHRVGG
jgi:hypothetical protein